MKKIIANKINQILEPSLGITDIEILKNKKNDGNGEYQTNIALKESKNQGMKPHELAAKIQELLQQVDIFKEIVVVGTGFLGFNLSKEFFLTEALAFMDKEHKPVIGYKGQMNYEFISANPTGWLHIGHARNAIVGDVFTRIAEYAGYDVTREYYLNDAGNQINVLAKSIDYRINEIYGATEEQPEEFYGGQEIIEYAQQLIDEGIEFSSWEELKVPATKHFIKEIKKTISKINLKKFDVWTSEKELIESGKVEEVLNEIKNSKYYFEENGATWVRTTEFGDDKDRVLVKGDGSFTYMVPDIANHSEKFKKNYEVIYNLWGKDHHGYEARIRATMEILGHDTKKLFVDYISMVKLLRDGEELKMSKRAGTSLTINEVVDIIDSDILKFFILNKSKEQALDIDMTEVEEQSTENPYWYAMYAYARASQILGKYEEEVGHLPTSSTSTLEWNDFENTLAKTIVDFADRVDGVVFNREPAMLLNYLKELAKAFHSFYNNVRVIGEDQLAPERVKLVISTKNLLENIFNLIGIKPKEKI